jgi:osmotically-inducible protein OsmY
MRFSGVYKPCEPSSISQREKFVRGSAAKSVEVGRTAMGKRALVGLSMLVSGVLLAQQPIPMGKVDNSSRNYHSADGTLLTKHSSDEDLFRALSQNYANDPEFTGVQVTVKHHSVKLGGLVTSKDAKRRAEDIASHTVGVRYVQNKLKVGEGVRPDNSTVMSSAH